jgi:hypothetical protein
MGSWWFFCFGLVWRLHSHSQKIAAVSHGDGSSHWGYPRFGGCVSYGPVLGSWPNLEMVHLDPNSTFLRVWYIYIYLVGGLEHFLFFHNIWDDPSHWLIFIRGVGQPPTRYTHDIHIGQTPHVVRSQRSFRHGLPFVARKDPLFTSPRVSARCFCTSVHGKFVGKSLDAMAHGWFTDLFLWNMVIFQQAMLDYQVYMGI